MLTFVSIVHVLLCVFMIFVILLQPGKDAGMGAALGGGAATSAFGGRGAVTVLGKITAVCAMGFFITSLGLSFVGLKPSVVSGFVRPQAPVAGAVDGGTPSEAAAPSTVEVNSSTAPVNPPAPPSPAPGTEAVPAEKAP